ncbi:hypothetical protein TNCV_4960161 [Trichonephila clavipes]|uniref:Secreted protein n=1 Tax=Trichonephila clavipes TaxID=2585209 RepID=A0A8X6SHX5_TRICX|nr:hypothetical protein TNCV_4960161 [Trichonephila clavipes]
MTRSSAPYLETTILLVLAWLGGVASLRQGPMGWLVSATGIEHCFWLLSKLTKMTASLIEKVLLGCETIEIKILKRRN